MSTFLAFFFLFATLGTFGYFLYELIWLHERFWQPLVLSVMTAISAGISIGLDNSEQTEQQRKKPFVYFSMILGYMLLTLGFALNRDLDVLILSQYQVFDAVRYFVSEWEVLTRKIWPFIIMWLLLLRPATAWNKKYQKERAEIEREKERKKAEKEKKKKQALELKKLKEKKLKILNSSLKKTKTQEEKLALEIDKLKKTIEEEKEIVGALEKKHPFIRTIIGNR